MGQVVATVPGVDAEVDVQPHRAAVGMDELAGEVLGAQGLEQGDPPQVQEVEEVEGGGEGKGRIVGELGPPLLEVGLDRRAVLGQGPLEAHQAVHVTVRQVVDHLADRPAAGPVGGVELVVRKRSFPPNIKWTEQTKQMFFTASYNIDKFKRFVFDSTFLQRYQIDSATQEQIRQDEIELLRFGMRWLKWLLFKEGDFSVQNQTDQASKA